MGPSASTPAWQSWAVIGSWHSRRVPPGGTMTGASRSLLPKTSSTSTRSSISEPRTSGSLARVSLSLRRAPYPVPAATSARGSSPYPSRTQARPSTPSASRETSPQCSWGQETLGTPRGCFYEERRFIDLPCNLKTLMFQHPPSLPFKTPQIPPHRNHKALK